MSLPLLIFLLRLLLALALYTFLGALFWLIWRDLRLTARALEVRARRMGRLVVLESRLSQLLPGATFPLLPITSFGRAPTNTIVLPDDTASLEHALLHLRDGQWWLEDLASRNGTRLNNEPITAPTPVVPGDVIGVGKVKLKMEVDSVLEFVHNKV